MSRFTRSLLCFAAAQLIFVGNVCASDTEDDSDSSPLGFLVDVFDDSVPSQNTIETHLQINALENIHGLLGRQKVLELQNKCDLRSWEESTYADEQLNAIYKSYNRITKMSGITLSEDLENLEDALEELYAKMLELNVQEESIDAMKSHLQNALQMQGKQNLECGTYQIDVALKALTTLQKNLNRMKVLTVQSHSSTIGSIERGMIQAEFAPLLANINIISTQTRFNHVTLFTGGPGKEIYDDTNNITLTPSPQTKAGNWTLSYDADIALYTLTNGKESYSEYFDDTVTFRNGVTICARAFMNSQESIPETVYKFTNGERLKSRIYYSTDDKISIKFNPFNSDILGLTDCSVSTYQLAQEASYALNKALDYVSLEIIRLNGLSTQLCDLSQYLSGSIKVLLNRL